MAKSMMTALPSANGRGPGNTSIVLPSVPISLPFPGEAGKVRVVYNLQQTMALDQHFRVLCRDLIDRTRDLNRERRMLALDFDRRWAEFYALRAKGWAELSPEDQTRRLELEPEFLLANDHYQDQIAEIAAQEAATAREGHLRVIGDIVVRVEEWPDAWGAVPDPLDPSSWDLVPTLILSWLASEEGGPKLVQQEMIGPLFGVVSKPTST